MRRGAVNSVGTGIRRKVDELGRIVIPVGIRRTLGIGVGDEVEFAVDGDIILVRRFADQCVFCGEDDGGLVAIHGRHACRTCLDVAADNGRQGLDPPAADADAALKPATGAVATLPVERSGRAELPATSMTSPVASSAARRTRGFEERYRLPDEPGATTAW